MKKPSSETAPSAGAKRQKAAQGEVPQTDGDAGRQTARCSVKWFFREVMRPRLDSRLISAESALLSTQRKSASCWRSNGMSNSAVPFCSATERRYAISRSCVERCDRILIFRFSSSVVTARVRMMFLTRRAWNGQAFSHGKRMRSVLTTRTSLPSSASTSTLIASAPDRDCAAATISPGPIRLMMVRRPSKSYAETESEPVSRMPILSARSPDLISASPFARRRRLAPRQANRADRLSTPIPSKTGHFFACTARYVLSRSTPDILPFFWNAHNVGGTTYFTAVK